MAEPTKKPPQQQVPDKGQGQKPVPSPGAEKGSVPEKEPQEKPKKKTPAQKKDEGLKYEMTYVNGGFNNGVQIKPDKNGKALIEISIYGGGQKKTLSVGPLPKDISKMVQAYELSANSDENTPEITTELQRYFEQKNTLLSQQIIQILREADQKIAQAIKKTFKN